jgi:DNA repair photolyase
MQKLASSNIKTGISIKPIIPFINDSVNEFMKVIETAIDNNASFIYPTFSINFDSKKINDFYDIIDIDYPEIMIRLKDIYGYKHIWESENVPDLKKNYIIACRKFKVLYAMKDIINLYKPETNIQMRLF